MKLHYKKIGNGNQNLIILHGLFGMLDNWMTLGNRFAENYTVWLIDQRNHGKSPHAPDISYPLMANDLHEFMEQHEMEKTFLIGHSMGGKTAMEFSFRYPECLHKLVVVDIAPKAYRPHHSIELEALEKLDLAQIERRTDADHQMARYIDDASTRQFLLKNLSREKSGYHWKLNLDALSAHYDKITGGIDPDGIYYGPTLFVKGENSRYIKTEEWPLILRQFPAGLLAILPGVGHWVHAEAPDVFFDRVEDFLSS